MITSMLRPDLFGAFATHSGDALSEAQYIPHFLWAVRHLRAYDGDILRWWSDFSERVAFTKPEDERLLELLGVSACFSPAPDGTPRLPFDPRTGALRPEEWARWLRWDPVRMASGHAEALRSQRAIWIDAGTSDEWFLDLGAEAFRRTLTEVGFAMRTCISNSSTVGIARSSIASLSRSPGSLIGSRLSAGDQGVCVRGAVGSSASMNVHRGAQGRHPRMVPEVGRLMSWLVRRGQVDRTCPGRRVQRTLR